MISDLNQTTINLFEIAGISIFEFSDDAISSQSENIGNFAQDLITKYPPNSTVTKLDSTFEIKRLWLHSEWAKECQFSRFIAPYFPQREELDTANAHPNIELIESVFYNARGKYILWQTPRETGKWKKIETHNLRLDWVIRNVEILYPSEERFSVSELNGIVLWNEGSKSGKRYQLYEGNHRVSAWLAARIPESLPAIIFIGKSNKKS